MPGNELLCVDEMERADKAAIAAGTPGLSLMETAGRAVADVTAMRAGSRPIVVLCGPGNNGGDGYVAARYLKNRGHRVRVAALGDPAALKGDAKANFDRWQGPVEVLAPMVLEENCVVVDALFGAGLARNIDGPAAAVLDGAKALDLTAIAVDLPSGVSGNAGDVLGTALPATDTVTFFRKKPGHVLYPGRQLCGEVHVVDIGIPQSVLAEIAPQTFENDPTMWRDAVFGHIGATAHKYTRGHLVIAGGERMTGATRLAARAARRAGAGLVTLAVPESAWAVYAAGDPGTIVEIRSDFAATFEDPRRLSAVLGPGLGVGKDTRRMVGQALAGAARAVVLDADALTSFEDEPAELFEAISGPCVLTPHEGEFQRLFQIDGDKPARARKAAEVSGAVIVLKGADTVIAAPDGRVAINTSAPRWLGTAGAGDVLAGICGGFLALGATPFDAACAAVWCHGRAATLVGPGLIAEDVTEALPQVFRDDLILR